MTEQRTRLDPVRLELIRRRLAAAGLAVSEEGPPPGSPELMSFGQQRLWFLDQLTPGTSAYHVPAAVRIRGPVEPGILQAALSQVVARHGVLRARYSAHEGRPRQHVDPPSPIALPVVGPGELGPDPVAGALDAARALVEEPFDLTTGPLLRAALYRLADDDHILAVVVHHIACDGASAAILVQEVCSTCLALAAGRAAEPPPLARQYWSYAQLQADQEAGGAWSDQVRFWRATLGDLTARLALPQDHSARPDLPGPGRAGRVTRRLDPALAHGVGQLAARHDATVFVVLLAAWHAQLARRTGATRVPVASPVNTRTRTEYEPLIGFFVNTLVMLGDTSGDPTFAELIGRTRAGSVAALGRQDVPFEVLVRELNPPRSLDDEPLAQVLFSYQPDPPFPPQSGAVAFEPLPIGAPRVKYSLTLYVSADDDGLLASMEYDATRWDRETIADWLAAYERLLADVCRDDTLPVSALDVPDHPVLAGPTADDLLPVTASVAGWVARTPEATALVDDAGPLRYDELAAAAAGLAQALAEAGAGPERPVLVAVPRGRETVIATLAALLVGAPFVPVDLTGPARRVAAIVHGARARVAVVSPTLAAPADTALPPDVLRVDPSRTLSGDVAAFCATATASRSTADLAYLMFTSGSTGVPKGVAVREAALAALLAAFASLVEGGPDDVTVAMTTTTFDISVLELLLPLTTGGMLRIIGDAARLDPAAIAAVIAADRVTIAQATPTTWRALLASGWQPPHAMRLLCGGEALDAGLAERLRATGCAVWNVYGPTETTIWSTAHALGQAPAVPPTSRSLAARADGAATPTGERPDAPAPPLGQPVAGEHLVVLGADATPVPLGTPGELAIGGVGLARGYWGDPRTTAARFVPDPFATQTGARLYRTGDVVRRRSDDTVEFLGRRDDQVKIRGHRVEPGEVAAEVTRLPGVRDCAVVAAHSGLVAFVTRSPEGLSPAPVGDDAWATELRAALTDQLPAHLLPSHLHVLHRLPVTPAGKLDRTALRDLAEARPAGRQPASGTEVRIAEIWTELLGRPTGADEDFFAVGGHSLLATQLARRVAEVTGAPIRVRHVFERPTIAGLAELVDATGPAVVGDEAGPQHRTPAAHVAERGIGADPAAAARPAPAPDSGLSSAQLRLVFLQRLEPASTAYHVTLAARFDDALDEHRLRHAFAALVAAHPALRTAVLDSDGTPARVVAAGARMPLRVADAPAHVVLDAATVAEAAALELREPFDLSRAPLARAVLVRGSAGDSALVLVAHHVILDGWSAQLLAAQLQRAYRGDPIGVEAGNGSDAETARSESLSTSAPGAGRREAASDTGAPSSAALDRAAARIASWPRTLALPLRDTGRTPGSAGHVRLPNGKVPAEALARFTRAHRVTPYPVLLAAWTVALARACDQPRLLVGAPYAGRDRPGTQDVVGLLATTLVVAADTRGDPTFADLVHRTAQAVRAALADADVPFDALVARTVTDRQLGRTPLFQAMFAYEDSTAGPAVAGTVLRLPTTAAKVPVGLWLAPPAGPHDHRSVPAGVSGELEYDASQLTTEFTTTLLDEFVAVVAGGLADPKVRVSGLGRPVPDVFARPFSDVPDPGPSTTAPPLPRTVVGVLDPARQTDPDALAVDGPQPVSFRELWRRAGVIADRLDATGGHTEEPIGVLVRSDLASYATILGVLRAGATYVPLDPDSPASWRQALTDRAGIRLVLDPAADDGRPPAPTPAGRPRHTSPSPAEPLAEQAAYVIHTSGSSGIPKGVVVEHRALAGYALGAAQHYGLRPTDRVLQLATLVYDGSLEELFVTWAAGATVVPAPREVRGTTGPLLAFLEQARITVLCLTTAHWHALAVELASGRSSAPDCLRLVLFGGEVADPRHAQEWLVHAPRADVVDTYGPTEATVVASTTPMRSTGDAGRIDTALPGVRLEVLGRDGRVAAAGQLGELVVGGVGVGRGYLGDPRATAASFVPDPTGPPGARRYRTGDVVRSEPGGAVRFAGRRDHELKVRGFRVEPSVVEAALLTCPGVNRAAVTVDGDRLVAGVEAAADAVPEPAALRARMSTLLPAHLVPSRIVVLDALPLNDHGKVDRSAIADAARLARPQRRTRAAPPAADAADPLLGSLLQVWSAVLGEPVGPHDDFFTDLGGHSLLALRLAHESATALGRDVPVRSVFEATTPVALAAWLHEHRAGPALPPIALRDASTGPVSLAQERIWRMQQAAPGTAQFTMAATARLERSLDPPLLAQAWHVLSLRHDLLRWRIRPTDSGAPEFVVDPDTASILVHDLRAFPADRAQAAVTDLVASARRRVFDLAAEPPVLLAQLRLQESDVLVLAAHHVGCDDATVTTLFTELAAIYRTIAEDVPLALPGRGPSAGDHAAWERAALAEGWLDAEREHWRQLLRPPLGRLTLLADRPLADSDEPLAVRLLGTTTEVRISGEQRTTLTRLAANARTTPFTVMLALVMRAVAAVTGQPDVRVATMAANRQAPDRAGLVGLLTNTVVVRCTVPAALAETLATVRLAALDAFDHQELPFEVVLADLDPTIRPAEVAPVLLLWSRAEDDGRGAVDRVAPQGASGFELVVDVVERSDRLDVTLVHEQETAAVATRIGELLAQELAGSSEVPT